MQSLRTLMLLLAGCVAAWSVSPASAAPPTTPPWYEVVVNQTGVAQGNPRPVPIVIMTDVNGAFSERWFKVDPSIEGPILDAARTAIASGNHARVYLGSVAPGSPVVRFYLMKGGIDMTEYLNFNVTKTYRQTYYPSDGSPSQLSQMVVSDTLGPGGEVGDRWTYGSGNYEIWSFTRTEQGLAGSGYRSYRADGTLRYESTFDHPIVWQSPAGVKRVGDSWGEGYVETRVEYRDDGTVVDTTVQLHTMKVTILGVEDVTVPAGTFKDCVKLYRTRGESSDTVLWYAKGFGWVKRLYSSGVLYELTSYTE